MNSKIVMVGIVALVTGADCGGAEESRGEAGDAAASFTVRMPVHTTAENVVPLTLAAGRGPIVTLCADHPDASVRVLNPIASGAYTDEWGDSGESAFTPFGLGCTIFVGGAAYFASHAICNHPGAAQPKACHELVDIAFPLLGLGCVFM